LVRQAVDAGSQAVSMLRVQHRMHPAIGRLVGHVFYENALENAPAMDQRLHSLDWLPRPVVWLSTSEHPRRGERTRGSSRHNPLEAEVIAQLLQRMDATYHAAGTLDKKHVAVITGYRPQVDELLHQIKPTSSMWRALQIDITTVDDFQGQERPIVIYSAVRSNSKRDPGFLRDRRRLNVALSRASELLLIVGDLRMLEDADCKDDANPFLEIGKYMRDHPEDCAIRIAELRGV